jgi:hypothetical protein
MGRHVRKYVSSSSVDAGNKETVPFCGERGKKTGLLFDSTVRRVGVRDISGVLFITTTVSTCLNSAFLEYC